ncbi:MAG: glycosyltransferase [Planctomycetota bacterium]|nr:glycosyltransferase [Planctomycetota bacterium]
MPDRIRVLFAIGSLGGGGSERQIVNILRHIDRSKFEPWLYLVSRTGEFLRHVPDDVQVKSFDDTPPLTGWYLPGRIRRAQIDHFARMLSDERIDVVYDRTSHMTLIAAPACQRAGVPRLSTVVANPASDLSENFRRFRWLKTRLLQQAYRTAARVIANSDSLAQECRNFYRLGEDQVVAIPNGFDFDYISNRASEALSNNAVGSVGFQIVTVGRLEDCKGFDVLFDAVNELVNVRGHINLAVTVAGAGAREQALKHLAAQHCLDQVIHFIGFLDNPYPLIKSADLFCLTSRYEGMPNVLVEAMSLGVPVLSTDCPHGPRDILLGGELGALVPPGSPILIADGIEQAMQRRSSNELRTAKAQASVLARFGVKPTTLALEEQLNRVVRK